MDVLQVLGTKTQQKNVGGDVLPADEVNWEEFLNASPDLLSSDIKLAEAENLDQIGIGEDVQTVAETDDAQVEPPLTEDVAAKPEGTTAVSVQEYSTTSEQNASLLLIAPQEVTPGQPELSTSRVLGPSIEASVFNANQPVSPLHGSLKHNFSVSGEAKTLENTQVLQQAAVKIAETVPKGIAQPVHRVTTEIAGLKAPASTTRMLAHRADLQEISGQIQNVLATEPETDGRVTEHLFKVDQTRPQEVEVRAVDGPKPTGIEAKDALLMDRLPQNLTGIDPRVLQTDSPVRFSDVGISSMSNSQPTIATPSNSAVAIANAPLRDQPILLQISQAIDSAETGKIELRLDPAELGKVRITMSARDGLMHATIMAERPETLDLLRRNSESLDMTFAEQGFGQNELSFEQFEQDDQSETPAEDDLQTERVDFRAEQAPATILAQVADGLDIKL